MSVHSLIVAFARSLLNLRNDLIWRSRSSQRSRCPIIDFDTSWQKHVPLTEYLDNSRVEIEHIHPTNASADAKEAFGTADPSDCVTKLGNLTLLEKPLNASIQHDMYSGKLPAYSQSRILLTRALAGVAEFGHTSLTRAVSGLNSYLSWSPAHVDDRQRTLSRLARIVWGIEGRV